MTRMTGVDVRWPILVLAAVAVFVAGAGVMYVALGPGAARPPAVERSHDRAAGAPGAPPGTSPPLMTSGAPMPDILVTLGEDAIDRARIEVSSVDTGSAAPGRRLPGVVEPNAYQQVVVTPLVAGRITRVLVELGQPVRRGQTMAQVFSPDLADAHTRYTAARAELGAQDRELQRTQQLVEIGAASRQELERVQAEHTARTSAVQSARSRLQLLGVPAAALDAAAGLEMAATASVPAPIGGIVTERQANVGLNVDLASALFTVVDLSTVWVVADLYEQDFAHVRVGSPATMTTAAYPGQTWQGRVSYIDPQVNPQTRTARVRIDTRNLRTELRLGMYVDVHIAGDNGAAVPVVPKGAVQTIGNRHVVYLAHPDQPGTFIEREVRLGSAAGEQVEVLSGVSPGDRVVSVGSFFLRAERERLGLGPPVPHAGAAASAEPQTATVIVSEQGFEPARVTLRAGTPVRLTVLRTTDSTCGTEVVLPALNITRALPLNEPVVIDFTTPADGVLDFACGMNMLRGTIVVQ
jgi:membrane fusion protein, heavy metal efflux system